MAKRISVFNPEGDSIETPQEARAANLRDLALRQGLAGGGGGRGDPAMAALAVPTDDGDNLDRQVEAKVRLMREANAAALAQGQQQGDFGLQGIDKTQAGETQRTTINDTGATARAGINVQPAMGDLALRTRQYGDVAPAMQAKAQAEASQAKFTGGIYDQMGSGHDPSAAQLLALGRDPRMLHDPLEDQKFQMDMAEAQALAARDPNHAADIYGMARSGKLGQYHQAPRLDPVTQQEAQQAANLPEVQRHLIGLADYISSVSGWWSNNNVSFVKQRLDHVAAALQNAGASPQAQQMVMDQAKGLIRNALDAEAWDAEGADQIRALIGDSTTGGGMAQGLANAIGGIGMKDFGSDMAAYMGTQRR